MALTKAKRDKLKAAGFSVKDIADIEAGVADDEPESDGGRRSKRSNGKGSGGGARVAILEGTAAESFLERFMGGGAADDADDDADADADAEDAEDAEDDDEPAPGPKWFGVKS